MVAPLALRTTVAGMASKGLRSSIYQVAQNNIGSRNLALPLIPLFAIPVVSCRCLLVIILKTIYYEQNFN